MPYSATTVKALLSRLCWSDLYLAYQSPFRHSQQHEYNLPYILGSYLPIGGSYLPIGLSRSATYPSSTSPSPTKLCIDASRHNVRHPYVVVSMIQQHSFGESGQAELG